MSARPDVVVVGGGVIGLAVALRLARGGAAVTLLERDEPGAHASTAAAGMLSPLKEADEPGPFLELGLRSLDRYPGFVRLVEDASGMVTGYRQDGRLDVALDDDAADGLHRQRRLQDDAGFKSRIVDPGELRAVEPAVSDEAVLGLLTEHDHQVDTKRLLRALWLAAIGEGVRVRTRSAAAGVTISGSAVTGVRLPGGETLRADAVVVAAGAWSAGLDVPTPLPVRPVRGQIVVLRTVPPALHHVTWGPAGYLVPRSDGRILVGSTMEEAGFAAEITAAACQGLLHHAVRLAPPLDGAIVAGFQVGLRPATPDGRPIIGRDPAVDGLVHATGHFRNGILLAPETAERVAALVLSDADDDPAFSPARFG